MIEYDEHANLLKEELARNEETISSLRARNIDITIRLIAHAWGISVGDVVCTPGGDAHYIVKAIDDERWSCHKASKPWIVVNPHTKNGIGWDTTKDMNLYARWEKV